MKRKDKKQFKTEIDNLRRLIEIKRQNKSKNERTSKNINDDKEKKEDKKSIFKDKHDSEKPKNTSKENTKNEFDGETVGEQYPHLRGEYAELRLEQASVIKADRSQHLTVEDSDANKEERALITKVETLHTEKEALEKKIRHVNLPEDGKQIKRVEKIDRNTAKHIFSTVTEEKCIPAGKESSDKKEMKKRKLETEAGSLIEESDNLKVEDAQIRQIDQAERTYAMKEEKLLTGMQASNKNRIEKETSAVSIDEIRKERNVKDTDMHKAEDFYVKNEESIGTGKESPEKKTEKSSGEEFEIITKADNSGAEIKILGGEDTEIKTAERTYDRKEQNIPIGIQASNKMIHIESTLGNKAAAEIIDDICEEISVGSIHMIKAEETYVAIEEILTGKDTSQKKKKKKKKKERCEEFEVETEAGKIGEESKSLRGKHTKTNLGGNIYDMKEENSFTGMQASKKVTQLGNTLEEETSAGKIDEICEQTSVRFTDLSQADVTYVTNEESIRPGQDMSDEKKKKKKGKKRREDIEIATEAGETREDSKSLRAKQIYNMKDENVFTGMQPSKKTLQLENVHGEETSAGKVDEICVEITDMNKVDETNITNEERIRLGKDTSEEEKKKKKKKKRKKSIEEIEEETEAGNIGKESKSLRGEHTEINLAEQIYDIKDENSFTGRQALKEVTQLGNSLGEETPAGKIDEICEQTSVRFTDLSKADETYVTNEESMRTEKYTSEKKKNKKKKKKRIEEIEVESEVGNIGEKRKTFRGEQITIEATDMSNEKETSVRNEESKTSERESSQKNKKNKNEKYYRQEFDKDTSDLIIEDGKQHFMVDDSERTLKAKEKNILAGKEARKKKILHQSLYEKDIANANLDERMHTKIVDNIGMKKAAKIISTEEDIILSGNESSAKKKKRKRKKRHVEFEGEPTAGIYDEEGRTVSGEDAEIKEAELSFNMEEETSVSVNQNSKKTIQLGNRLGRETEPHDKDEIYDSYISSLS